MLKIILFDGTFATTTFINRLAKGLSQKHQVYILGFNEQVKQKITGVTYVQLGSNTNYIRLISTSVRYGFTFGTLKYLVTKNRKALQQQNLKKAIQKIQPDIIHLQWLSNISWFEKYIENDQYTVILSQRGYHVNVRPFVNTDNMRYLQKWYPKISGFHSVSKAMQHTSNQIYAAPNKIDEVVYSGFPIANFTYNHQYKKHDVLQILSVGRTHWKKGFDYALKACAILKQNKIPFHCTIIGANTSEELLYLIHDMGLQKSVTLLPKQSQESVYMYMQKATVLLMPSVEEGLPNVVVEAMLLGVPVIATHCGGTNELVEPQKTGWLVPTRNPVAIANAIIDFQNSTEKTINSIRKAARQKAEKQHNIQQMVTNMEALYQKCIHAKN